MDKVKRILSFEPTYNKNTYITAQDMHFDMAVCYSDQNSPTVLIECKGQSWEDTICRDDPCHSLILCKVVDTDKSECT